MKHTSTFIACDGTGNKYIIQVFGKPNVEPGWRRLETSMGQLVNYISRRSYVLLDGKAKVPLTSDEAKAP